LSPPRRGLRGDHRRAARPPKRWCGQ